MPDAPEQPPEMARAALVFAEMVTTGATVTGLRLGRALRVSTAELPQVLGLGGTA